MRRSRARAGAGVHAQAELPLEPLAPRPRSRSTPAASGSATRRASSRRPRRARRAPPRGGHRRAGEDRLKRGTCTVTCAYLAALRIVELRMVSEASFSFGITSRALSSVRMKVYISPISSTTPSTPLTSTQSPSRRGWVIAIISPATKFPSVRCEAKPMIRPRTAEEASSPPATARTWGITSRAERSAERDDRCRDGASQDAVAGQRLGRAVRRP